MYEALLAYMIMCHWQTASGARIQNHGRCDRTCARTIVGRVGHCQHDDGAYMSYSCAKPWPAQQNESQNHGFRTEIQNEDVRQRLARTIAFVSEIVVRGMGFE